MAHLALLYEDTRLSKGAVGSEADAMYELNMHGQGPRKAHHEVGDAEGSTAAAFDLPLCVQCLLASLKFLVFGARISFKGCCLRSFKEGRLRLQHT